MPILYTFNIIRIVYCIFLLPNIVKILVIRYLSNFNITK